MSLQPKLCYEAPEETARIARAALPQGTLSIRIYDALGTIFQYADFVSIFPPQGQPAETPVRLALATILQFVEGLSDRGASDAVRSRINWKYLLCLELTDPGFDHTVLSEFRTRLLKAGVAKSVWIYIRATRQPGIAELRQAVSSVDGNVAVAEFQPMRECGRESHPAAAIARCHVGQLRRPGAVACHLGRLRRRVSSGRAAHARDRHPHGVGRGTTRRAQAGGQARDAPHVAGRGGRAGGGLRSDALDDDLAVWRQPDRPADVCGDRVVTGARGAVGLLDSGEASDQD